MLLLGQGAAPDQHHRNGEQRQHRRQQASDGGHVSVGVEVFDQVGQVVEHWVGLQLVGGHQLIKLLVQLVKRRRPLGVSHWIESLWLSTERGRVPVAPVLYTVYYGIAMPARQGVESLDPTPVCVRFSADVAAKLRAMSDRSAFIREAVEKALKSGQGQS